MARRFLLPLAVLLCAAAVAAAPATAMAVGDCLPAVAWPGDRDDLATQVVGLINAHRAQLGLPALAVSPTLTAAATWKARHMAAYGYMTHDDPAPPVARTAGERIAACGYPAATWGENIAEGYKTAQAVVDAWLNSPGHRANIENPAYHATGVGAAGSPLYWSQTFGSIVDAVVALPSPPAPAPAPAPASAPSAAQPAAAGRRPLLVSCAQRDRRVACRVRNARGAPVHLTLRRGGRTFARARMRAQADLVRVTLHPVRRLRDGRYVVVARVGAWERHVRMVVR
ncbi:MAG TPA: CAP domain-containing protein [Solirubrobacteraceae bacterium]